MTIKVSLIKCDCAIVLNGTPVYGTAPGMDVPEGVQYCQDCCFLDGDLVATAALAAALGGTVAYYQHDDAVSVDAYDYDDPTVEARLVARLDDGLGEPLIHGHTNPWVERDGLRFDFYARRWRPLSELRAG